jgi:hypothetical protein
MLFTRLLAIRWRVYDIPAMLELLEHSSVDGAGFKLLDVVDGDIHEKKAIFTIYTSADPEPHQSKCIISEIEDDTSSLSDASYSPIDDHEESDAMMSEEEPSAHMATPAPATKKQKKNAKDVTEVRRSTRIAKLCDGFKDKAAADQAKANMNQAETGSDIGEINKKKKKAQVTKKSNKTTFSASVIDTSAPPPPELSIDNVQAIGVGQCRISPEELSADKLNATSG